MAVTLDLSADLERRLRDVARALWQSEAELTREAVIRLLEDIEDGQLAAERLANPGRRWTLEELKRGADLAG